MECEKHGIEMAREFTCYGVKYVCSKCVEETEYDINDEKRERFTFTTYPSLMKKIDENRDYMSRSEFIHRVLSDWYNNKYPNNPIRYWEPSS